MTSTATIVRPHGTIKLRRELPKSWATAAGLLRNRRRELELHLNKVRREWHRDSKNDRRR